MWLLAQLRQPGRSLYKDLTRSTFEDHLKLLLSRKNFNNRKEVDGQLLSQPCWSHCLSYEYEIRKEAYKLCRLRAVGIAAALKEVTSDNEHRTQHWVQLIAIANSSSSNDATIARLEKEVELLRSAMQRSRSPRMRPRQRALPPSQQMLALPTSQTSSSSGPAARPKSRGSQNSRKAKGAGGKGRAGKKAEGKGTGRGGVMSFEQIMDLGGAIAFPLFHESYKQICWRFQKGQCDDSAVCKRKHNCIGCNTEGKPYNFCHCFQSKLN